jgi:hypothetical protein
MVVARLSNKQLMSGPTRRMEEADRIAFALATGLPPYRSFGHEKLAVPLRSLRAAVTLAY